MSNLLSVRDLRVSFFTDDGEVKAVGGVSFEIERGKMLAIVGESGCGKSITSLAILRLVPSPGGKIIGGEIVFKGQNILELSEKRMRQIRGNEIAIIFQEPMTSLNPVYTIGYQIAETILQHEKLPDWEVEQRVVEMLSLVGISDPQKRIDQYPHQLSGGMRQRVMIAIALSCNPSLLIADEPTTALDVTIQAQILELLLELQKKKNMSIMLITHDLGVVAENADDVIVMYASKIVEKAGVEELFENPLHPYTKGLLRSLPKLGSKSERLETIKGSVPDPLNFPNGCKFHPRCPVCENDPRCLTQEPELKEISAGRFVACWKVE